MVSKVIYLSQVISVVVVVLVVSKVLYLSQDIYVVSRVLYLSQDIFVVSKVLYLSQHTSAVRLRMTKHLDNACVCLTSFPCDFRKSISSGVKLAMEMDLTLCGGFSPRLKQTAQETSIPFISVQFKMVSTCSEQPILSQEFPQHCLSNSSNVHLIDNGSLSYLQFHGKLSSISSFRGSLLQVINDVMSLALCPEVGSQAPQHFGSSEMQATCDSCFARQSVCSVISLHSNMSRAVYPQECLKVAVDIPIWASHSAFHFL